MKAKSANTRVLAALVANAAIRRVAGNILLVFAPFALWSAQVSAQDNNDLLLCSMNNALYCNGRELSCNYGPSTDWNVPVFFEVDFKAKVMKTTQASHDKRRTPLQSLQRIKGVVYAQGVDKGKGFTLVVDEGSGSATGSIVTNGESLNLYGACMFLPK